MATAEERGTRTISTAACLIIGDEMLNGSVRDTNSYYMAKKCREKGIELKRIEIISDNPQEMIDAFKYMSDNYDFVVTSGGIGFTHDDRTYAALAKAYGLELELNKTAFHRMRRIDKSRNKSARWDGATEELVTLMPMLRLPFDKSRSQVGAEPGGENLEALVHKEFTAEDLAEEDRKWEGQVVFPCDEHKYWVPVSVVNGNIHVLPGVPSIFNVLLDGLLDTLTPRLDGQPIHRVVISTMQREGQYSKYLGQVDDEARRSGKGVKAGTYPKMGDEPNDVMLVGKDRAYIDSIVPELARTLEGTVLSEEQLLERVEREANAETIDNLKGLVRKLEKTLLK